MDYYSEFDPYANANVTLVNKSLWDKFAALETEMIITKNGRNVFPQFLFKVTGLSPERQYHVRMEFVLANKCRLKYAKEMGWQPAGAAENQSVSNYCYHPNGPQTGRYWMDNGIDFKNVKLTNTARPPPGQIVLTSMHRYKPLLVFSSADCRACTIERRFYFEETNFIAVTAYQNRHITELKISYNKFAKGFRFEGKASTKRKRQLDAEEDIDVETVDDDEGSLPPNLRDRQSPDSGILSECPSSPEGSPVPMEELSWDQFFGEFVRQLHHTNSKSNVQHPTSNVH